MTSQTLKARLERRAARVVFGSRTWIERQISSIVGEDSGLRILEIGSGRQDLGQDAYSMSHLFGARTDFVRSDVNPEFGHRIVDLTADGHEPEFDVVLCVSVLEHIEDLSSATRGLHSLLVPGGRAIVSTPFCFPYHDEPADYWRFTMHGMQKVLRDFDPVEIRWRGARRLPFTVLATATRPGV